MSAVPQAQHFDELFGLDPDPWGTRTRWYEARKRALTLACLPRERYDRACEPGCGAGETTAALAQRCGLVMASDASEVAVRQARARLASFDNVQVSQARMPHDWPAGRFDLVVLGELGYYLSTDDLRTLVDRCRKSLTAHGTVVGCHWRRRAPDMRQSAQAVHAELASGLGLRAVSRYEDGDFLLDVWSAEARSVAQREGLA